MKKLCIIIGFMVSVNIQSQELNVMTFNIRLNIKSDSLNAWPYRKDNAASQILFHNVHLLGVQEALHEQMMDLSQSLSRYKYAGVARDDGITKGEYSAIFYDTTRLKLTASSTFWLSLTPEVAGSKSWDAAITRIVTWAKFRDVTNKKVFFVFNTHFDHIGKEARRESAKLLKEKVKEVAGNNPVIVMGDFNSKPSDDPIKILVDSNDPGRFIDTKAISLTPHYGPQGTFNAFTSKETDNEPIDFIFIKGKWKVLQHATLSQTWGGRFSSDHFPVFAKLNF
ncbi:MAG TPA: endonuclease/exonuclease/phosphatase family protein [Chitinophagaceae bacterium]|nr:endonuclease/exonuclease/phosphatase family protein [Chitinophagaceae bacterium]